MKSFQQWVDNLQWTEMNTKQLFHRYLLLVVKYTFSEYNEFLTFFLKPDAILFDTDEKKLKNLIKMDLNCRACFCYTVTRGFYIFKILRKFGKQKALALPSCPPRFEYQKIRSTSHIHILGNFRGKKWF